MATAELASKREEMRLLMLAMARMANPPVEGYGSVGRKGYAPQAMLVIRFMSIWPSSVDDRGRITERGWSVYRLAAAQEMGTRSMRYVMHRLLSYCLVDCEWVVKGRRLCQVWRITDLGRRFVKEIDIEGVF